MPTPVVPLLHWPVLAVGLLLLLLLLLLLRIAWQAPSPKGLECRRIGVAGLVLSIVSHRVTSCHIVSELDYVTKKCAQKKFTTRAPSSVHQAECTKQSAETFRLTPARRID